MLPVWGEPMLARVVEWLRDQGVAEIAVNCHHLHDQVEAWCEANGCRASCESEILGTGGALNPLRDWIGDDNFWLVNGDIVFENCKGSMLSKFLAESGKPGAEGEQIIGCCLAAEEGPRTIEVEPDGGLVTCWHSPDPGWNGTYTYCGVALLKAEILRYVKPEGFSSIIEAYEKAAMDGKFVKAVHPRNLLWSDAGTVDSYIGLNRDGEDNAFGDIPQILAAREACGQAGGATEALEFCGARGSDRAFFRNDSAYFILYDDAARCENARYAGHARWLKSRGVKVPEVLADLPEMKTLVLQNAGSEDLAARARRRGEDRLYDYVAVVEELAKFNSCPPDEAPPLEPPFDAALYEWERGLFAEHCLGGRYRMQMGDAVEKELRQAAERLLREPEALVHRDFQSSNVIWKNENFVFIDFQGMRRGPAVYDLASLLYDPYMDLRDGERRALAALYGKKTGREDIAEVLPFAAVERLIQALGAYGRLVAAGQASFGRHIAPALENLLSVADAAGMDAVGALAEDLLAKETALTRTNAKGEGDCGHHHGDCTCGHHHHGGGK